MTLNFWAKGPQDAAALEKQLHGLMSASDSSGRTRKLREPYEKAIEIEKIMLQTLPEPLVVSPEEKIFAEQLPLSYHVRAMLVNLDKLKQQKEAVKSAEAIYAAMRKHLETLKKQKKQAAQDTEAGGEAEDPNNPSTALKGVSWVDDLGVAAKHINLVGALPNFQAALKQAKSYAEIHHQSSNLQVWLFRYAPEAGVAEEEVARCRQALQDINQTFKIPENPPVFFNGSEPSSEEFQLFKKFQTQNLVPSAKTTPTLYAWYLEMLNRDASEAAPSHAKKKISNQFSNLRSSHDELRNPQLNHIYEYFERLSGSILANSERFKLFGSVGGEVREEMVSTLIEKHLPPHCHTCNGIIIDSKGNRSNQLDAIVLKPQPFIKLSFGETSRTTIALIENVALVLEVKSNLNVEQFKIAATQIRNVHQLKNNASLRRFKANTESSSEVRWPVRERPLCCIVAVSGKDWNVLLGDEKTKAEDHIDLTDGPDAIFVVSVGAAISEKLYKFYCSKLGTKTPAGLTKHETAPYYVVSGVGAALALMTTVFHDHINDIQYEEWSISHYTMQFSWSTVDPEVEMRLEAVRKMHTVARRFVSKSAAEATRTLCQEALMLPKLQKDEIRKNELNGILIDIQRFVGSKPETAEKRTETDKSAEPTA